MGGKAPHLGLVLQEGTIDGYEVNERNYAAFSNFRGLFSGEAF